jgi:hypothetical protein
MDEQQVFLTVLEKPEIAPRIALFGRHFEAPRRRQRAGGRRDIGVDAIQRVDRDALALAQAMDKLAVIDRAPAECRLGKPGLTAEIGDLLQDRVVHEHIRRRVRSRIAARVLSHARPFKESIQDDTCGQPQNSPPG